MNYTTRYCWLEGRTHPKYASTDAAAPAKAGQACLLLAHPTLTAASGTRHPRGEEGVDSSTPQHDIQTGKS